MREELHAYVIGIFRNYDSPSIRTNSVIDHIHSVFRQSPQYALKDIVEEVKRGTTKWIRQRWPVLADFSWQIGYGAFSVGQTGLERVVRYIENQAGHHKRLSFEDEMRELFRRAGYSLDEYRDALL